MNPNPCKWCGWPACVGGWGYVCSNMDECQYNFRAVDFLTWQKNNPSPHLKRKEIRRRLEDIIQKIVGQDDYDICNDLAALIEEI